MRISRLPKFSPRATAFTRSPFVFWSARAPPRTRRISMIRPRVGCSMPSRSNPPTHGLTNFLVKFRKWPRASRRNGPLRLSVLRPCSPAMRTLTTSMPWPWKSGAADFSPREAELRKAIALDSKFGDAYLHLGLLQIEQRDFVKAVESLQRAVDLTSLPDEAHLRLAQVYRELGEAEKARQESQLYSEVSEKKKAQLEQERHELGQFVYTMQGDSGSPEKPAPKPQ